VTKEPTRFGPIASKRRAQLAARALDDFAGDDLAAALAPLRAKLRRLARDLRFEDAARLRDRVAALEAVVERVSELERLRAEELCLLAPAREPGFWRAFVVADGRVTPRTIPQGTAGRLEIQSCVAAAETAEPSLAPEDAADLLVVSGFLRRPPPELRVVPLRLAEIQAA
jgi:excinuclease UvrABC nuclease subunit